MSNRFIAAYGEMHCEEEYNEWLPHKDFTKAKSLWQKSNNDPSDNNYHKARELIQKHLVATFDKSNMINHFADKVADQDEDGWTNVSAENIIYGKRKSIFTKYNDATYEREDVDSISVISLDFFERDYDDEPDESSVIGSPHITFALVKSIDIKDGYENQGDIDKWQEKNDFDLEDCFSIEINENTTAYIDEDGYESSGYSISGGTSGSLLNEKGETLEKFSQRLNNIFLYGADGVEVDEESQSFFENLANGNFEEVKNYVGNKNINVNIPLIEGIDSTKPLSIVFHSAWLGKDKFLESFAPVFATDGIKNTKQSMPGLKELIFYLAAQGADLQQKIGNVSYLTVSVWIDPEITEFLLSFGFDPDRDSEILSTACESGNKSLVEKFIELGAKVDPKGLSTTPLMYAAQGESENKTLSDERQNKHIEIIDILLQEGAKINHVDSGGDTALTNAVRCNNELIVNHLIKAGAEINGAPAKNALKPIKIASEKKFQNIIDILIEAGAEEVSLIPKGKKECPECKKIYAESTIQKWKGLCGACYRKKNPREAPKASKKKKPVKKQQITKNSSNEGCFDKADGCFDTMDDLFEIMKMLAITGLVLYFIVAIIWAIFTS
jgi:uncharacterized protein